MRIYLRNRTHPNKDARDGSIAFQGGVRALFPARAEYTHELCRSAVSKAR